MGEFDQIDAVLSRWAEKHSLHWYTEYQDTEVRAFYLNPNRRDRVQIAVDVPRAEMTTIRIGQNQRGLSQMSRGETIATTVFELPNALDKALKIASQWVSDAPPTGNT